MSETKRIKILETEYKEEEKLVYWTVKVLDEDKTVKLAMRSKELMDGFGIVGDVTDEQLIKFLSDIKDKELKWVFDVKIKEMPDKMDENNVSSFVDAIDEYPFPEVLSAESREQ
jgi:hypothetical protein